VKKLLIIAFILSLGHQAFSQGVLRGKVTDGTNKEGLIGANVFLVGTYVGGAADFNGKFRIEDIKPGDYTVRITYLGFNEKIYTGIRIKDGEETVLNVQLEELGTTLDAVVIVGEKNLVDLESGKSQIKISSEELKEMNLRNVQEIVALQAGVTSNPDGIQIRGGRVYETSYRVEGLNAQDPLAGTGGGVEVASNSVQNIDLVTGGGGAEFGDAVSGVILTRIKEGGDKFSIYGSWQRDNLGFNNKTQWNTDILDLSIGGPIPGTKNKLKFFVGGHANLTDNYYGPTANQLYSSLGPDVTWAPRQANRWSNSIKLSYELKPNSKFTLTNQYSLNVNQSTRSLQIVGNDAIIQPGFQYFYSLALDQANTYTHRSNLTVLNFSQVLKERWRMDLSVGRLFVNLRADANGRPFRKETVTEVLNAQSIVTTPVGLFNPDDSIVFVLPGPGLANNGGIASLWHDHWVEEYTLKGKFKHISKSNINFLTFGFEQKIQEFQWIDVTRPWVGAPIKINDSVSTPLISIGSSSDVWAVKPKEGAIFGEDEIKYKGIIATFGLMFKYWAPGAFVDDAIDNPEAPIVDPIRESYLQNTVKLLGLRWKTRLLPKLNVSFPVTENNVLYFNYGHSMRLPHPRFIYQGLDPQYQNSSFLSNLGNPDINPEVSVSYEFGLKTQVSRDLAFTITTFYIDRFDYIVSRRILIKDQTGRLVDKTFYINQDYARIRGLELTFNQRIGKWFRANASFVYQIATGKSNTAAESELQINTTGFVNTTTETFLAWDRPFELKGSVIFRGDESSKIGPVSLNNWRAFVSANFKSGLRYTPYLKTGVEPNGRDRYERDFTRPYEEVGSNWFWIDFKVTKDIPIKKTVLSFSFEIRNLTDNKNAQIVNPVTGRGYEYGDPLPVEDRDPSFADPTDNGIPPFDPARYMAPTQMLLGVSFGF
jgi:outer membrane receptor protein involved in Fe transport